MDYNNYQPNGNYNQNDLYRQPIHNPRSAGMETAAFVLGIISIVTCTCIYASIVCGSLAIMFALLSKGGATSMSKRANYALVLGVIGIVVTIAVFTIALVSTLQTYGSFENMMRAYSDLMGMDYEELYNSMTP